MTKTCKICGEPVFGKNKYCESCKKEKKREYQRTRYWGDEEYRKNKIKQSNRNQQRKNKLGSLYNYSWHANENFDREHHIVKNMSKKVFGGRRNTKKHNNNESFKNYNESKSYENNKLNSMRTCQICGGTHFIRERGEIVCTTCGLCHKVFADSVYGLDTFTNEELENDKFVRALRKKIGGDN